MVSKPTPRWWSARRDNRSPRPRGSGNLVDLSGATVASGSLSFSANAQYAIIDTQGFEGASFTITGFGTATLAVQWSNLAASGFIAGTISTVGSSTTATTVTANGQYTAASGGRYMKILVTAFTTGPIVVTPVLIAGSSVGGGGGAAGDVNLAQVGGAAVTAGAGAVAAGTLRTTLASDDPAVVALQAIQSSTTTVNVGFDTNALFVAELRSLRNSQWSPRPRQVTRPSWRLSLRRKSGSWVIWSRATGR
jgi:hypothetical protein